ncbi:amino acid permease, APC family [Galdieria sulphuraria]|uniref:Amino acid permease, APC family n=1 Tax=Galdieria sulphuraria TaxID=130081 RepID=M2XTB8_GALSU|nr:amino acid permease, APC family [Galdieria sulphuraria]EME26883.1 amino acid permease, APC family [Galdieria sulphuraria]|eukprot:XP_005703403.1 amino acid permease, APC family [Galdieria sulphuraria]
MLLERFPWLKFFQPRPSKSDTTLSGAHGSSKGKLRLLHLVFQSISGISPAGSAAATLTAAAYYAKGALPFAQLLSFIAGYLLVNTTWWFSRQVATSGGFLGFAAAGIGPRWAGPLFSGVIESLTGKTYPTKVWVAILIGFYLLIALMVFSGIRLSLDVAAYTGIVELILLFVIAVVIAARAGDLNTGQAFNPDNAKNRPDFAIGALLSLFTVAGYSSAVNLAEEVSRPRKQIPIAVLIAYTTCGSIFVITAYAYTIGWGYKHMDSFANALVPGIILTRQYADDFLAWLYFIFIFQSTFFICVASLLVAVRIVFAMARDGIIFPWWTAKLSKTGEPHYATALSLIVCFIISLVTGLIMGSDDGYNFLAVCSTLSIFSAHILANTSLPFYFRKIKKFRVIFHAIAPILANCMLLFGIFFTMYPYDPQTLGAPIWTGIWLIATFLLTYVTPKENLDLYMKRLNIRSYDSKATGGERNGGNTGEEDGVDDAESQNIVNNGKVVDEIVPQVTLDGKGNESLEEISKP